MRIDFFRGVSLYMVLVDHISRDDPISKITYRGLGFSDAAEIFFFLSGVSCGIAYSHVLARSGWLSLMRTITHRVARIYFFYVMCSLVIIMLSIGAADLITNLPGIWPSLLWIPKDPVNAVRTTIELASPAPNTAILISYIFLTLILVPLFLAGAKYSAGLTLGLSGLIWIISQFCPNLVLNYFIPIPTPSWIAYFYPFAWQFLFSIGMFFGIKYESPPQLVIMIQKSKWVLTAAWAIVIGSLLCKHRSISSSYLHLDLSWLQIPYWWVAKSNLAILPLLHFLSVALLVATYVKASNPMLQWTATQPFTAAGRRSLELYSCTVVLSVLVAIVDRAQCFSFVGKIGLDSIAITLMALTAIALTRPRQAYIAVGRQVLPNLS